MIQSAERAAAEIAPVAAGVGGFIVSWHEWQLIASAGYSYAIAAGTLAYVIFRAANEYRKWRRGATQAED